MVKFPMFFVFYVISCCSGICNIPAIKQYRHISFVASYRHRILRFSFVTIVSLGVIKGFEESDARNPVTGNEV